MSRIVVIPLGPPDASEGLAFSVCVDGSPAVLLDAGSGAGVPEWVEEATAHDNVWLSHGHRDHAGAIGSLLAADPRLAVVLPAKAVASSIAIAQASGMDPSRAHAIFDNARRPKFHEPFDLGPFSAVTAPSGHGLGAGLLRLELDSTSVGYTGDWALHPRSSAQPADLAPLRDLDLLLCEAALAGAARLDEWSSMETISELIQFVGQSGPRLLAVSAFAEFAEVASLVRYRSDFLVEDGLAREFDGETADFATCRRHLADGGLVVAYGPGLHPSEPAGELAIPHVTDPSARIALFNAVPRGTPAATMFGAKRKERRTVYGENRRIRAHFRRFDFPTHASRPDLIRAILALSPRRLALFHAPERALKSLAHALEEAGFTGEIVIAEHLESIPAA